MHEAIPVLICMYVALGGLSPDFSMGFCVLLVVGITLWSLGVTRLKVVHEVLIIYRQRTSLEAQSLCSEANTGCTHKKCCL